MDPVGLSTEELAQFAALERTFQAGAFRPPHEQPPAITAPQAQGDVLFVPGGRLPHWAQVVTRPVTLIASGHGHTLTPTHQMTWAPIHSDRHVIGVVSVPEGAAVMAEQPRGVDKHEPLVLGPGIWTIRRQTEVVVRRVVRPAFD